MSKNHVLKPEEETLGAAMNRTEMFFEQNSKKISIVLVVILAIVALGFGYNELLRKPRMEKAADMLSQAQGTFEAQVPDYKLALEGDDSNAGFLDVIDSYSSTSAGNLAKHYAGVSYMKLGDLENAQKYLSQYSEVRGMAGSILNAENYGLLGDIAVENGNYDEAVKMFDKAVEASDNTVTAPMYLKKLALVYVAKGNVDMAKESYLKIREKYSDSYEAQFVDTYLGGLN